MVGFDAVDFSECHSKEVIKFLFDAQCIYQHDPVPLHFFPVYPEVQARRRYIYNLLADKDKDLTKLREHYAQFTEDLEDTKTLYQEQMEKLLWYYTYFV